MASTKTQAKKPADTGIKARVTKLLIFKEHDPDTRPDHLEDPDRYDGETPANRAKYQKEDKARLEAWNRDEWHYVGIYMKAVIEVDFGAYKLTHAATARSGGLWGIEDDSDESWFEEVVRGEFAGLKTILAALHVTEIPDLKTAEWKGI